MLGSLYYAHMFNERRSSVDVKISDIQIPELCFMLRTKDSKVELVLEGQWSQGYELEKVITYLKSSVEILEKFKETTDE